MLMPQVMILIIAMLIAMFVIEKEVVKMTERDKDIIYKIKHPLTPEQVKEKYGHLMNQRPQIFDVTDVSDDDELTDEEIDNLLDGQEDDTVDDTYDGDYNPHANYDAPIPESFDDWSHSAQKAWMNKHKI